MPVDPDVRPRALNDAPEAFTATSVREYLAKHGARGVLDIDALSVILGTVSTRTIREHVANGGLKALNQPVGRESYVFALNDVVAWLLKNPKYIAQRRETWEPNEATPNLVRALLFKNWKPLTRMMEVDDIVSEVMVRMLTMPKTTSAEGLVINRTLGKIYRKLRNRPGMATYHEGKRYDE